MEGIPEGTRVMFVGVGTFIIILFAALCVLLCLFAYVVKQPM
jgi:hypothetical protein